MTQYGFQFELPLKRNGYFFMSKISFDQYLMGLTICNYPFQRIDARSAQLFMDYINQPEVLVIHFRANGVGEMVKIVVK